MFEAVIFDMDGVLFDTERFFMDAWEIAGKKHNFPNIYDACLASIGVSKEKSKEIFKTTVSKDFPFDEIREEVSNLCHDLIKTKGIPTKKGVKEILSFCKEKGYKIGLATSTRRQTVLSHLQKANILDYFDEIVCGDEVTNSKPFPEIYLKACQKLSVEPQDALSIEDSYNGVRASTSAGVRCIMVPDILPATDEMKSLALTVKDDLLSVIEFLKTENLQNKRPQKRAFNF